MFRAVGTLVVWHTSTVGTLLDVGTLDLLILMLDALILLWLKQGYVSCRWHFGGLAYQHRWHFVGCWYTRPVDFDALILL